MNSQCSKMRSQHTQIFWPCVAKATATHKPDWIFNFHTNQFWFFPLYECLSKQRDNNISFAFSTAKNNKKGCKSYTDNPKHLHSEWGQKKFTEVHQLWLPQSQWIWNKSTKHSTIPVNTSKSAHMQQKPYNLHNISY